MKLEEKLISLRKKQGLTQQELARKLEVSRQAVSKWEVGLAVPNTDNLKILSDLYNVPVDYLLNDEQEKPDTNEVPTEEKSDDNPEKGRTVRMCLTSLTAALAILLMIAVGLLIRNANSAKHGSHEQIGQMETEILDSITNTFQLE